MIIDYRQDKLLEKIDINIFRGENWKYKKESHNNDNTISLIEDIAEICNKFISSLDKENDKVKSYRKSELIYLVFKYMFFLMHDERYIIDNLDKVQTPPTVEYSELISLEIVRGEKNLQNLEQQYNEIDSEWEMEKIPKIHMVNRIIGAYGRENYLNIYLAARREWGYMNKVDKNTRYKLARQLVQKGYSATFSLGLVTLIPRAMLEDRKLVNVICDKIEIKYCIAYSGIIYADPCISLLHHRGGENKIQFIPHSIEPYLLPFRSIDLIIEEKLGKAKYHWGYEEDKSTKIFPTRYENMKDISKQKGEKPRIIIALSYAAYLDEEYSKRVITKINEYHEKSKGGTGVEVAYHPYGIIGKKGYQYLSLIQTKIVITKGIQWKHLDDKAMIIFDSLSHTSIAECIVKRVPILIVDSYKGEAFNIKVKNWLKRMKEDKQFISIKDLGDRIISINSEDIRRTREKQEWLNKIITSGRHL